MMIQRFSSLRKLLHQACCVSSSSSKIGAYNGYASHPSSSLPLPLPLPLPSYSGEEYADVDWDSLGFGLMPTDFMYINKCSSAQNFGQGQLSPYGHIQLSPSAGVLNYGQGLFEGTKAYRKENGKLLLFRPEQNAIRMQNGAERMCMISPSIDHFVDALKQTVLANKRWVPPPGKGSLYLRPLLLGTGPVLGLAPSPEYTFLIYASPVRNYFKEGSAPLNLFVEEDYDRASRRGTGSVKTISNYAPVLMAQIRAKSRGFSDVLYLDSATKKNLEEVSSCNIFIAKDKYILTPATNGTILAGITRKSVIEIARDHGYQVEERAVTVDELIEADEVFCTGTAVGVAPVGSVTYQDKRVEYITGSGTICQELNSTLLGIQTGIIEDKNGWVIEIN
ncbi:PREDICTED: branched-chain-amino-acid aminotransferase 2, chloroplastic-like isoform X2 [Lupinus angustifolius]|uniref:branched-chain-amino-acid aminotransferase 2, chloroplastic-like isoform X2 n=1 Tax=Lupinus angustifolius TaxID=3871 RepID=UPI00092FBEAB|nr:PREDICTED: branched-chain-amino-acid aminotransferase 2, chloroplastic-like isoform X2 [Lupinus angustifolius]